MYTARKGGYRQVTSEATQFPGFVRFQERQVDPFPIYLTPSIDVLNP